MMQSTTAAFSRESGPPEMMRPRLSGRDRVLAQRELESGGRDILMIGEPQVPYSPGVKSSQGTISIPPAQADGKIRLKQSIPAVGFGYWAALDILIQLA